MKNDDPYNENGGQVTSVDARSRGPAQKGNGENQKPRKNQNSSNRSKKKSFFQVWKSYSRVKQAEIIFGAVLALAGAGYKAANIVENIFQNTVVREANRPHVIISRPPVLYGSVYCQVTDNAIHIETGPLRIWVKEIGGKGNAQNAFIVGPEFKLVPEKKIANPFYDDPPEITDQTCKMRVNPKMKEFPVYAGQEVAIDIAQTAGTISLIKTNSVSVAFGLPQPEPKPAPGEKREGVHIAKDATFQLYAPICVYYFESDGTLHGNCRTYRMSIGGTGIPGSGRYSFTCAETPVTGSFDGLFGSFCDN